MEPEHVSYGGYSLSVTRQKALAVASGRAFIRNTMVQNGKLHTFHGPDPHKRELSFHLKIKDSIVPDAEMPCKERESVLLKIKEDQRRWSEVFIRKMICYKSFG